MELKIKICGVVIDGVEIKLQEYNVNNLKELINELYNLTLSNYARNPVKRNNLGSCNSHDKKIRK